MKDKKSEKLIIIRKTVVQFPDLEILGKQVIWAQSAGRINTKYYVWVEDEEELDDDIPTESIRKVPLNEVLKHGPNVCKSKNTAETIFDLYLESLKGVSAETLDYFHSKTPIILA